MNGWKRATAFALVLGASASLCGCATTEFRRAENADVNGIRYYRPATYILVKPDYDKQQADVSFWSGPDTSVPYAVDPSAWAATNTTELKFSRGMLTDVTSTTDSTKIATETIAALGEVAKSMLVTAAKSAALATASVASRPPAGGEPPIYLFVASADGTFKQIYGPPLH